MDQLKDRLREIPRSAAELCGTSPEAAAIDLVIVGDSRVDASSP